MSAFPITPPKSLPEPHANLAVDRLVAKVQELRKEGLLEATDQSANRRKLEDGVAVASGDGRGMTVVP